jgi:hypothetical protein
VIRREFITLLGGAAAAWPLAAAAQQGDSVRRIGVLLTLAENDPEVKAWLTAFQEGLQQLGWVQGRNIRIDYRWAGGDLERLKTYAAELVRMAPDVLFCNGVPALMELHQEKPARCRSCSCRFPIRSSLVSSRTWRGRAATLPGLSILSTRSGANGSN